MNVRDLLAIVAVLLSGPAVAQSEAQTPENAQRFIAAALPKIYSLRGSCPTCVAAPREIVSDFSSNGVCETNWYELQSDRVTRWQNTLNWGLVTQVTNAHSTVQISVRYPAATNYLTFDVGSQDMAARLTFAMEFLKRHCDPTAGMGF